MCAAVVAQQVSFLGEAPAGPQARRAGPFPSLLSFRMVRRALPAEAREVAANPFRGPEDVALFVRPLLEDEPSEVMLAVFVDTKHHITGVAVVGRGGLDHVPCDPREVFRAAILANAACVILAHNHPSGDPEPSAPDIAVTERLAKCGELMGIALLDHLVTGARGRFVSLKARGVIPD